MKLHNSKNFLKLFLLAGVLVLFGCRPSVREVVKIASQIPIGVSRDEVKNFFIEAYSKKYPDKASQQSYTLPELPRPLTGGLIEAENNLIAVLKKQQNYIYIYPSNLCNKLSDKCFYDGIGVVTEASEGNGSLTIYYDNQTNYIGFIAESEFDKKEQ